MKKSELPADVARLKPPLRPYFFLNEAIRLYAPEALKERDDMEVTHGPVEGHNLWAKRYGLPWRTKLIGDGPMTATHFSFNSGPPVEFTVPPRPVYTKPKDYVKDVEQMFKEWKAQVLKVEGERYKVQREYRTELEQRDSARRFVLYQFRIMSQTEIADWELKTNGNVELTKGDVSKSVRRFALLRRLLSGLSAGKGGW